MSYRAVTWAYDLTGIPSGQKFVLVTLCHHADEEWSCYPSVMFISTETGISQRTVREHLDTLEKIGAIKRDRTRNSDGTLGRYRYFIQRQWQPLAKSAAGSDINKIKAEAKSDQPAAVTASGEKAPEPAAKSAAHKKHQKKKHQINLSDELTGPFEALWSAWPAVGRERTSRRESADAFVKACANNDPEAIVNAAARWTRKNTDPQYVPGLHRWLTKGRFEAFMPGGNVVEIRAKAPDWTAIMRDWLDNKGWPKDLGVAPDHRDYGGPFAPLEPLLADRPADHPFIAKLLAKVAIAKQRAAS